MPRSPASERTHEVTDPRYLKARRGHFKVTVRILKARCQEEGSRS